MFAELIPFVILGALLGLDVVSFPQAMLSRPIVACTLAGALAGEPGRGLLVGAALELFALETLPFGASRYPEWGSGSVAAGAIYALQPANTPGALSVAVAVGLVTASIGGWSMVQHRRLIAWWAGRMRDELARGSGSAVVGLQLRGLTADLVRGGLVTAGALAVFVPLSSAVLGIWSTPAVLTRAAVVMLAGAVAGAAIWKITHNTKGAVWFLAGGLAVGLTLLAVT
jgi:mannose/fructose/N-acetylgalactosamine-specific phosphotransferase system component IIC